MRDKANVKVGVLTIERCLLGGMRHRRFYSLAELNTAIGELLRQLNDERPIRRLGVTRRTLFEELDRPNLNSLPAVLVLCRMARPPGRRRLPCRARQPFLQRPLALCPQRGRGAADAACG